jgi:hypothetical protein
VGATWRVGTGKKEGPRARRGMARAAGIGPRPAGAGGGIAVRQWRVVVREQGDASGRRVGPGDSGARWGAAGSGRARQRGAALTRGTRPTAGEGGGKWRSGMHVG